MSRLVRNAEKTKDDKASNGNINRYREVTGLPGDKCSVVKCGEEPDIVGAHVTKMFGDNQTEQFIVPLCKTHNNQFGDELLLEETVKFMKASKLHSD